MPNGTILLIDDETMPRQAVARTLELEGYTVRQTTDAMRGLETLRDYAAEILVILSDVKLPDGRGLERRRRDLDKGWPGRHHDPAVHGRHGHG